MIDDHKLAEQHAKWYIGLLKEQFTSQFETWMKITEKLMIENFIHGMKHARQEIFNEATEATEKKYKEIIASQNLRNPPNID